MERFWKKVDIKHKDECWNWIGNLSNKYGKFWLDQKYEQAHRVSYILTHGAIPPELVVRHKCDNPACVNPNHLELGTHKDNSQDCNDRNRRYLPKGEVNTRAILKESDVYLIREDPRKLEVIANAYGVSKTTIRNIKKRRSWKHLV